jgi:hypothetical protein
MHPAITYDLIQAHVADLRVRARRHTLARAARPARRKQRHAVSRWRVFGRRINPDSGRTGDRFTVTGRVAPNGESGLPESQLTIKGTS